jgi:hypothetical protein
MASKQECLRVLEDGEARTLAKLTETSPDTQEYMILLKNLMQQRDLAERIKYGRDAVFEIDEGSEIPDPAPKQEKRDWVQTEAAEQRLVETAAEIPSVEEPPQDEAKQEEPTADDAGAEKPRYTKEEVRAALRSARTHGVNVSAILRTCGVDNFNQMNPDDYAAVMQALSEEGEA